MSCIILTLDDENKDKVFTEINKMRKESLLKTVVLGPCTKSTFIKLYTIFVDEVLNSEYEEYNSMTKEQLDKVYIKVSEYIERYGLFDFLIDLILKERDRLLSN